MRRATGDRHARRPRKTTTLRSIRQRTVATRIRPTPVRAARPAACDNPRDDDTARRTAVPGPTPAAVLRPPRPGQGRSRAHRRRAASPPTGGSSATRRLAAPVPGCSSPWRSSPSAPASCSSPPAASAGSPTRSARRFGGLRRGPDRDARPVGDAARRSPTRRSSTSRPSRTRTSRRSTSSAGSRPSSPATRRSDPALRRDRRPGPPGIVTEVAGRRRRPRFLVPGRRSRRARTPSPRRSSGPRGESEPSPVVTYVLDQAKPRILKLTSPKNGAVVNAKTVEVSGDDPGAQRVDVHERHGEHDGHRRRRRGRHVHARSCRSRPARTASKLTVDRPGRQRRASRRSRSGKGSGKLTAVADSIDLPDQAFEAARAGQADGRRDDPDGQAARGRPGHVHARGPGHPGHRLEDAPDRAATARASWSTTIPKGADDGPDLGDASSSRPPTSATRRIGPSSTS